MANEKRNGCLTNGRRDGQAITIEQTIGRLDPKFREIMLVNAEITESCFTKTLRTHTIGWRKIPACGERHINPAPIIPRN